jgi:hypothetical protein
MTRIEKDLGGHRAAPSWRRPVVIILVVFAALMAVGVVVIRRYIESERHIKAVLAEMTERGPDLDAEGCVDAVLEWAPRCTAMKTLCDASVPRVMEACLSGRDRDGYCASLGARASDTHFGVPECKARGVTRATKKVCALAYRAIDGFCRQHVGPPL